MRGSKVQILEGSVWKNVPKFAVPVALTGILGQLFNAADIAVVGRFTGTEGTVNMAAVGANSPVVGLILNVFIGVSLGSNVVIANAVGRKDWDAVQKAVHSSILFSVLAGAAVTLIGELTAVPLLTAMQVPSDVLPKAVLYLRIYLAGVPAILLYNFESAIFRSVGETRVPLIALALSGILNVFLNLFLVLGMGRSVDGVALATVLSNLVSSVYLFILLTRTELPVRVHPSAIRIEKNAIRRVLQIGLPAGIQSGVFSIANIVIQSAINSLGTNVIAASGAALNIEIFCYDILNSFSQACTTFVGQNYGAGYLERCRRTLKVCIAEGYLTVGVSIAFVLCFGRSLLRIFNTDPEVIELGYLRLCIILASYSFSMLYEVLSGYLRGFGISLVPAILTTIGVCGTRIFWIFVIFPRYHTFRVIMTAYPVSLGLTALLIGLALVYYRPTKRYQSQQK